jgi:single-stranded-DNA-specific exonuclease
VARARALVESDLEIGSRAVIVVAGDGWHRGVIGIVASKLVDAFHRPAIVLSIDGDLAHGSCRSIPSFDILAALTACAGVLGAFGGHKQAAGLTIEAARIRELRSLINDHAEASLQPDDLRPRLWIDGGVTLRELDEQFMSEHASLAPFGAGNPSPLLTARRLQVVDGPRRIKDRHLKMAFREEGRVMRAVAWRSVEREAFVTEHRDGIDVASRWSAIPGTASSTCSCRSPISGRPSPEGVRPPTCYPERNA